MVLILATIAAVFALACAPTRQPASVASLGYEVAYRAARAVRAGDELCARVAIERHDKMLAERCAKGYEAARGGLLAVEATLDTWSEASAGALGCAAQRAVDGMLALSDALAADGIPSPQPLTEATRVAARLAASAGPGLCIAGDGGADG